MKKKIIVVGAGIIGSSLAYYLSRAGAEVLVLDTQEKPGGVATPHSFAWINASWGNSPAYVKLRMRAMAEWRSLDVVHPGLAVNWCGGLLWDLPVSELREFSLHHEALGYQTKFVTASQIKKLEPSVLNCPDLAVHVAGEGAIEPLAAVNGFMAAAQSLGAKFHQKTEVLKLLQIGEKIVGVATNVGVFKTDEVVLAAGINTQVLLQSCDKQINIAAPAGLLVHSKPVNKCLNGLIMSPLLHVRQTAEGRLVAGSDFGGAQPGDDPAEAAENLFAALRGFLRGFEKLEMDFFSVGYRPTPSDGLPVIGRPKGTEGLYVSVMHSGITLAPIVGMLGAQEILQDKRDPLLSLAHPDRFTS